MSQKLSVIILAAGKGTRMKSDLHKVLHPIAGKPILLHLMDQVAILAPDQVTLVVGNLKDQVMAAVPNADFAEQVEQNGTGHAVMAAQENVKINTGDVLILCGDVPFMSAGTMQSMIDQRHKAKAAVCVLGFIPKDPGKYGRLVIDDTGSLDRIVEFKDANEIERAITLCNSGMMVIDAKLMDSFLAKLSNDNNSGEYYLTDVVEIARNAGHTVTYTHTDEDEIIGINSRKDLALAETIFQNKRRGEMMDAGITMIDPSSVFFAADTVIDADVTLEPHVFFGADVTIGKGSIIKGFSHIEGATIGDNAQIGPYARLRPGTELADNTKIGNFVETKKAKVGKGSKINHLSYVGDAELGETVNVGAGTITCNYDGFNKAKTMMGDGSFIGSNTALVAPVNVGAGAIVAAGSTITKDIPDNSLGLERAKQSTIKGYAVKFRKQAQAKKDASKG